MTTLSLTPEQQQLRDRYLILKREFSELFALRNEIVSHDIPFLTSLYLELIGRKLYEVYCLSVELSKLKQRLSLLQAYINRNEIPDLQEVDSKIEVLFTDYQRKIDQEAQNLVAAREFLKNGTFLSEEETSELKNIYRTIVKRLHPDINPGLTEEQKELFLKAQIAYQLPDISTLRIILVSLDMGNQETTREYNLTEIVQKLSENVNRLKEQTDKLNKEFPCIYRENLKDEVWIKSEQDNADDEMKILKTEIEKYKQYVILLEEWKPA